MKKLILITVLFIAFTGFKKETVPTSSLTNYYVLSAFNTNAYDKWIISNIAEQKPDCKTDKMVEFLFSDYCIEKYGNESNRTIQTHIEYSYEEAVVYRQKLIEENKEKGKETVLLDGFVIKCQ